MPSVDGPGRSSFQLNSPAGGLVWRDHWLPKSGACTCVPGDRLERVGGDWSVRCINDRWPDGMLDTWKNMVRVVF